MNVVIMGRSRYGDRAQKSSSTDACLQYWDWGRWSGDSEDSPVFDGSDTSLSGNGEATRGPNVTSFGGNNGGGCVTTGPFKKYGIVPSKDIYVNYHPWPC